MWMTVCPPTRRCALYPPPGIGCIVLRTSVDWIRRIRSDPAGDSGPDFEADPIGTPAAADHDAPASRVAQRVTDQIVHHLQHSRFVDRNVRQIAVALYDQGYILLFGVVLKKFSGALQYMQR